MADTKISEFADGSPLLSTDEIVIARAGENYKIPISTFIAMFQAGIQFADEGVNLGTLGSAEEVDFVGAGVTATRVGDVVTVTVAGAGSATDIEIDATGIIGGLGAGYILLETGTKVSQNAGLHFAVATGILTLGAFTLEVTGNAEVSGINTGDQDLSAYLTSAAAAAAYQPLDADLTAIAALATTAYGRGFLTYADEAAFKAGVNLEAGTDFLSPAAIAAAYQPLDADLTAVAALATTGIVARTGAATYTPRTITGTANQISVTDGDGVAGAPVIALTDPLQPGVIQLLENKPILLDETLSADGQYSGICIAGTAGATLAFGDLCYFAVADSRWELTDADAEATAGGVLLGICVLAAAADGDPTRMLLIGNIRADAAFPALTVGAPVYVSTTPGDVQVAQPSGTDDVIRIIGHARTADALFFNPSPDWMTHV